MISVDKFSKSLEFLSGMSDSWRHYSGYAHALLDVDYLGPEVEMVNDFSDIAFSRDMMDEICPCIVDQDFDEWEVENASKT